MPSEVKSVLAMFSLLLLLFCAIVNVLSSPALSLYQCKPGDDACVTNAVKAVYPLVLEANSEIGAEDLDPMFQPLIEGNLSILKFKLYNSTIIGFKSCAIQTAKYSEEEHTLQVDMLCPAFTMKGWYDVNGRLIVLPVEGNGEYQLNTKKYRQVVNMELKTVTGKDGKSYRNVKNFKVEPEVLEPVKFEFKNLFNGQKDLSDAVHMFANEHWKEVAYELQGPIYTTNMKKIIQNANKYLKTLPIDEYIKQ